MAEMTSYRYYGYDNKYNKPEYWLKNKKRYEKKYAEEIEPRIDDIKQWLDDGEPILEIAKRLHTSIHTLSVYRYLFPTEFGEMFKNAIHEHKVKAHTAKTKYVYNASQPKETLCWRCNNIVPNPRKNKGCEWSMYDEPVPGWSATETTLTVAQGNTITSYCVHKCPKFKRLERGGDT